MYKMVKINTKNAVILILFSVGINKKFKKLNKKSPHFEDSVIYDNMCF